MLKVCLYLCMAVTSIWSPACKQPSRKDSADMNPPPSFVYNVFVHAGIQGNRGILAISSDGLAIAADDASGGKAYIGYYVDTAALTSAISWVKEQIAAENWRTELVYTGPDAAYTELQIVEHGQVILLWRSWHETAERTGKIVATATGLQVLQGRSAEEIMAEQPLEYRNFRSRWAQIRERFGTLRPLGMTSVPSEALAILQWNTP